MNKYARIYDAEVQELFSTDGDITEMFHPDFIWVDVTGMNPEPAVGWSACKEESGWVLAEPTVEPPSDAELMANAIAQRDVLLQVANERTAGMADAYIAGLLDDADTATFKAYAVYKLALNKITAQPGYPREIDWPASPL